MTACWIALSYTGSGFDLGAKLGYGGFTVTGYYYDGKGLGTTGLFILSTDALGRKRSSNGWYGQAAYTIDKFTIAGSYGVSHLSSSVKGEVNPLLLDDKNSSYVGQARYGLTLVDHAHHRIYPYQIHRPRPQQGQFGCVRDRRHPVLLISTICRRRDPAPPALSCEGTAARGR
jgi:hypothetical protein